MFRRVRTVILFSAAALLVAGCAGNDGDERSAPPPPQAQQQSKSGCRPEWRAGWQQLANRVGVPVYCPGWMPSPLDALIGGQWDSDGASVSPDRSYLVDFLWHEAGSGDVHVNFRGYPGKQRIPRCEDVQVVGGVKKRRSIPCFSDPQGKRSVGPLDVTVYTVNRDADQWHVLYAWRRKGSLYTVSEHVAHPLTFREVVRNLDRVVKSLELVEPAEA